MNNKIDENNIQKTKITLNSEVAKCIKNIGEDLIKRADDISRDLDHVVNISISSVITGGEIVKYDVNKEYSTCTYIDYQAIKKDKERENK